MPVMTEMQQRLLDEMRGPWPSCHVCGGHLQSNPAYMRNLSGDVRITLICPNRDEPHPDGHLVAETFLRPDKVRTLRL